MLEPAHSIYNLSIYPDAPDDTIIRAEVDGLIQKITLDDLLPYWPYANVNDLESLIASVAGPYIGGIATTAQGQGGILFLWDCDSEQIVHASNGSHAVAFDIYDGYVYALHMIETCTHPASFCLSRIPLGIHDCFQDPEYLPQKFPISPSHLFFNSTPELCVSENGIGVYADNKFISFESEVL